MCYFDKMLVIVYVCFWIQHTLNVHTVNWCSCCPHPLYKCIYIINYLWKWGCNMNSFMIDCWLIDRDLILYRWFDWCCFNNWLLIWDRFCDNRNLYLFLNYGVLLCEPCVCVHVGIYRVHMKYCGLVVFHCICTIPECEFGRQTIDAIPNIKQC